MGPAWTRSFRSGGVKPPAMPDNSENHAQSRLAWNQSAEFWSRRMGEGNDFVDVLIWPCVERLIGPIDGRRVLDIACGNGLYARRLSQAGADVVAVDFAADMVRAASDATPDGRSIEYRQVDACDPAQLTALREDPFDAAVCLMAFMDMSDLGPLLSAIPFLVPNGPFVFATSHPAFNGPHVERNVDASAQAIATTRQYMTPSSSLEEAIRGQPVPHPHFHRSLSELLSEAFRAGLVLDALEERAFPPAHQTGRGPNPWGGTFSEFPAVLMGRLIGREPAA